MTISKQTETKIVELYLKQVTIISIQAQLHVAHATVYSVLKKHKIPRDRYPGIRLNELDELDDPEALTWIR